VGLGEVRDHVDVLQDCPAGPKTAEKGGLSALRAHTKAPYKMDFHRGKVRNAKAA
jgi:hypothetical protein